MLFCLRMRSTFACVFDWECKLFFYIRMCGGVLSLNALKSCCLNIRSPNVAKEVLHCKNYTSIIKLTNLSLSFSPLWNPLSPLSSLFFNFGLSLLDLCLMSYINTIPMENVRHGTDMVQAPVFEEGCAFICTQTHTDTHARRHTAKTITITVYELR